MPDRLLRGSTLAIVLLLYALILGLPGAPVAAAAGAFGGALGDALAAVWPAKPVAVDGRVLELAGVLLTLALATAGLDLHRRRRRGQRIRARVRRLRDRSSQLEAENRVLRGRHADWIETRDPVRVTVSRAGDALVLGEHRAAPDTPAAVIEIDRLPAPDHREALRARLDAIRHGRAADDPIEVLCPDGVAPDDARAGLRWLSMRFRAEPAPDGGDRIVGIAHDVTEEAHARLLAGIDSIVVAAWSGRVSLEEGVARVLRALGDALAAGHVELWWVDERFEVLRHGPHWVRRGVDGALARRSRPRTFGKGVGLAGRVWAEARVVRFADLARELDPRCARVAQAGPFRAAVGFPVRIAEGLAAVVVALSDEDVTRRLPDGCLDRVGAALGRLIDHKRAERALLGNEARKNAMLDSALDCVITVDAGGRIIEFNPAAERTFGRPRSEVLGQPMAELLIPDEHRGGYAEAFGACLAGERRADGRRLESEGLRADGSRFPVEVSVTTIHVGDAPCFTAYLRDITERKALDRLKDELVSTVSHELRTPLTSMRGFVELLLTRDYGPEERNRFLGIVETEIERLGKLIDDFLDLQRLESGRVDYDLAPISLRALIVEAIEVFEAASDAHRYEADLEPGSIVVMADADRIRQLLRNLLSNATKYSPDGGVVVVSARSAGAFVRVGVRDPGIGMDEETLQGLFSRFFRSSSAEARRVGGTGLGLALVKEIVEAHGGEVGVESKPGEGSEFSFTLAKPEKRG